MHFLQKNYPKCLPRTRAELGEAAPGLLPIAPTVS